MLPSSQAAGSWSLLPLIPSIMSPLDPTYSHLAVCVLLDCILFLDGKLGVRGRNCLFVLCLQSTNHTGNGVHHSWVFGVKVVNKSGNYSNRIVTGRASGSTDNSAAAPCLPFLLFIPHDSLRYLCDSAPAHVQPVERQELSPSRNLLLIIRVRAHGFLPAKQL